jgi:hypothetical protein
MGGYMREIPTEAKLEKAKLLFANIDSVGMFEKVPYAIEVVSNLIDVIEYQGTEIERLRGMMTRHGVNEIMEAAHGA